MANGRPAPTQAPPSLWDQGTDWLQQKLRDAQNYAQTTGLYQALQMSPEKMQHIDTTAQILGKDPRQVYGGMTAEQRAKAAYQQQQDNEIANNIRRLRRERAARDAQQDALTALGVKKY